MGASCIAAMHGDDRTAMRDAGKRLALLINVRKAGIEDCGAGKELAACKALEARRRRRDVK